MTGNETTYINNATHSAEASAESFAARLHSLETKVALLIQIIRLSDNLAKLHDERVELINKKVNVIAEHFGLTPNTSKEVNS